MRALTSASALAILLCLLLSASYSYSQNLSGSRTNDFQSQKTQATDTHSAKPPQGKQPATQFLYSGRLMGYFRVPDQQPRNCPQNCNNKSGASEAAKAFFEQRKKYPSAVLVGTGDNFAPDMDGRAFWDAAPASGTRYQPLNKEYYQWDPTNNEWLAPDRVPGTLRENIAAGYGTIGTDNVGCFLRAAGYAAVVPGKHDFYFGPERLRELARFLASPADGKSENCPAKALEGYPELTYRPVQMLAANLVIKTTWIEPKPARSETGARNSKPPHWHFPGDVTVQNLSDGARVYPWFSSVRLTLNVDSHGELLRRMRKKEGLSSETESMTYEQFRTYIENDSLDAESDLADYQRELKELRRSVKESANDSLSICLGDSTTRDPSAIKFPDEKDNACRSLTTKKVRIIGNALVVDLPLEPERDLPPGEEGHVSYVLPGENYGLCLTRKRNNAAIEKYCLRFSVHVPFFLHPGKVPSQPGTGPKTYTDPLPYVYLKKENVAIFGVMDTDLGEHVGLLNFAWRNTQDKSVKTVVAAEDPAEALRQQLEYFERRNENFNGIKILLAQMSPQRAKILATRVPGFQIVVSAADQEQDTVGPIANATWMPAPTTESSNRGDGSSATPTFYAVPSPFFNPKKGGSAVDLGFIGLHRTADLSWKLHSKGLGPAPMKSGTNPAPRFWRQVAVQLEKCKGGEAPVDSPSEGEQLRLLTLCAMQKKTTADAVLIQKRDLFTVLPDNHEDYADDAQKILDRIIWKGDFLTVLYVPGSSLLKAMARSKQFDEQESAPLSLENETGRGLYTLGIREDADKKQYFVNEVPLDPAKLYAVATTDYIGAGDTGYPDLIADAISPPNQPARFPKKLDSLGSVVCRELYPGQADADKYCYPELVRDVYLDESAQGRPYAGNGPSLWSRLFPRSTTEPNTTEKSVNQKIEFRPLWDRDIRFTIGFNALTNNLSDAEIDKRFSGVTTSSVTAHATRTLDLELQTRFSHSLHKREFFLNPSVSYNVQHTGFSDKIEQINQISNLTTLDSGLRFKWRDRALPHLEGVLSVHLETPTVSPITTFALSTPNSDRLQFHQGRGLTFLPRVGLRWQGGIGALEVGAQGGAEFYALRGYQFTTNGIVTAECLASATKSFVQCVKELSKPDMGRITPESEPSAIRGHKPRAGGYWKMNFEIPLSSRLKYTLDDDGDFFPANFSMDNATDTRFRYFSRHSLKVAVWQSLSFGPAYKLFLFQNKVNKDFLVQQQFLFEMDLGFDVFNSRGKSREIRYRSPAPKH